MLAHLHLRTQIEVQVDRTRVFEINFEQIVEEDPLALRDRLVLAPVTGARGCATMTWCSSKRLRDGA